MINRNRFYVGLLVLVGISGIQNCDLTNVLGSSGFTFIKVSLTGTSCFICPKPAAYYSINFNTVVSDPPGVITNSTTLVIRDWSAYSVSLTSENIVLCIQADDGLRSRTRFIPQILNPAPVISISPANGPYAEGTIITLTCVTQLSSYSFQWSKRNSLVLEPPVFVINGSSLISTITIMNVQESNSGTYICSVEVAQSEVEIVVASQVVYTTSEKESTTSPVVPFQTCTTSTLVIIVVSAAFIFVILIVAIIINNLFCYYYCKRNTTIRSRSSHASIKADDNDGIYESVSIDQMDINHTTNLQRNRPENNMPLELGMRMEICAAYEAQVNDQDINMQNCMAYEDIVL